MRASLGLCPDAPLAQVVELVDTLASGASGLLVVGVQVSPWAPSLLYLKLKSCIFLERIDFLALKKYDLVGRFASLGLKPFSFSVMNTRFYRSSMVLILGK